MRLENAIDHRDKWRKVLEDRLLPRCEAAARMISPEGAHKAEQTLAILRQIQESGWIHSWTREGQPEPRFKAGDAAWIGGIGDDEMLTPYIQVELPQSPTKLLDFLDVLLKNPNALNEQIQQGYVKVKSAEIRV